ncbi:MAG TPA: DUF1844 domain-containing protein [Pyrinomonadaceae bacterium]|jgi:hypothetical protein|nr:DUF1844 domain-containing protein [Pyrinomonadaceae bacterium]
MSEEKPTFKVTDRRLFNPDGSPREDVVREEPPPPPAAEEATPAREPDAGARAEAAASAPVAEEGGAHREAAAGREEAGGPAADDDPQDFLMVVEFVASFAADALGMVEHPGAGRGQVNLPLARQCIDMLRTLQRKTRGNLSLEEQQVFEMILSQLQMQYVSLTSGPRAPQPGGGRGRGPGGFSGGDITGGR